MKALPNAAGDELEKQIRHAERGQVGVQGNRACAELGADDHLAGEAGGVARHEEEHDDERGARHLAAAQACRAALHGRSMGTSVGAAGSIV